MLNFIAINHFCSHSYQYGLNFELQAKSVNFIGAKDDQTYLGLYQNLIQTQPEVQGSAHFDKYELFHMGPKTKCRFLYSHVQVFDDQTFYNESLTVYEFLKQNWLINHLNTHDFETFFESFCLEMDLDNCAYLPIKELSVLQRLMVGFSLAFFNNKKYLFIQTELDQYPPEILTKAFEFLTYLTTKQITILWFSHLNPELIQNYHVIDLDDPQYDHMPHHFIINDETYLASKYALNMKKWFQMTSITFKQTNLTLSLIYGFLMTFLFAISLFFANKPVSLFGHPLGWVENDIDGLLIGVILLIVILGLTVLYIWYLFYKNKAYFQFLLFSGISKNVLNFLICFIILAFVTSVILSSYIILLITYSSFDFLMHVKWVSSIYFPISLFLFNLICCMMCANMIKNNLLKNPNKKQSWLQRKIKTQKENKNYGKKI